MNFTIDIFDLPWWGAGLVLLASGFLGYKFMRIALRLTRFCSAIVGSWLTPRPESFLICPNCNYDIRFTPHRCPECGTKLLWGLRPSERDLRRRRPEWIDH